MDFFYAKDFIPQTALIFCPSDIDDGIFIANMMRKSKGCCTIVQSDIQMAKECAMRGYDAIVTILSGENRQENEFLLWLEGHVPQGQREAIAKRQALGYFMDAYELGEHGCFAHRGFSKSGVSQCLGAMLKVIGKKKWHEARGPVLRQCCERMLQEGLSRKNLLIKGAQGCGKSSAAMLIHLHSRQNGKFVLADCSGYQDAADAFKGRKAQCDLKKNPFYLSVQAMLRASNGGTLLFDNVDMMPISLQSVLAETLESGKCFDTAAKKCHAYKGRLVFTTLDDSIEEKVMDGRFSERLYRLMTESVMRCPSIAEYRDDIPALAEAFAVEISSSRGLSPATLSPEAKEKLRAHIWVGNVWELYTALSSPCSMRRSEPIHASDIFLMKPLAEKAGESDKNLLMEVLKETRGNVSEAGRILGKDRATISRQMKKYSFSRKDFLRG